MQKRTSGEREGEVTSLIETQTSKIPSGVYLSAAVGAMTASAILKATGKDGLVAIRRALGTSVSDPRPLQQDCEAKRDGLTKS